MEVIPRCVEIVQVAPSLWLLAAGSGRLRDKAPRDLVALNLLFR